LSILSSQDDPPSIAYFVWPTTRRILHLEGSNFSTLVWTYGLQLHIGM
jgi:hypothetical protein